MTVRELSYQNLPVNYTVLVNDIDIDEYLDSVGSVSNSLDLDKVSEFTVDSASFTVENKDGIFSQKPNNFFDKNSLPVNGYNVPVKIRCGFEVDGDVTDKLVFVGTIVSSEENVKFNTVTFKVNDLGRSLRDKDVINFGIPKTGKIEQDPNRTRDGIRGVYPLGPILSPVSEESVSGTSGGNPMVYKQELDREGNLNPLNFNYREDELITEGGALDTDPIINADAPFRHRHIDFLVRTLLNSYDITNHEVNIPDIEIDESIFSTLGRPGYDVLGNDTSNTEELGWQGFITDFTYGDWQGGTYFLLMSHRQADIMPRIIIHNAETDNPGLLYKHPRHAEFWKVQYYRDNLYILGTEYTPVSNPEDPTMGFRSAHYNSAEQVNNDVRIWRLNLTNLTLSEIIGGSDTYPPQLASMLVLPPDDDINIGFGRVRLPDTNKGFQIANDRLFYRFATAALAGVASTTVTGSGARRDFSFSLDKRFNETSHDFIIDGSKGYCGVRWVTSSRSNYKEFEFDV